MENPTQPFSGSEFATDASVAVTTTEQLLTRFVQSRDQQAFEALLRLYGPLVYGVCRRVLGNHHDAEEVFQSTFLILARKADSIHQREGLATWLHRVAYHAALRARTAIAARRQKETRMDQIPEPVAVERSQWLELAPLLDQELNSLPIKYRLPVLLCDLAGKTHQEAAQHLGCPEGTLSSRLARARKLLAGRLTRQGIILSSATLVVLLSQNAASAAVPATLFASTLTAASAVSATQSTVVGTAITKTVTLFKSAFHATVVGKTALVGIASTVVLSASLAMQPEPQAVQPPPLQAITLGLADAKLVAPFEEIANSYRTKYSAIETVHIEYTETEQRILNSELLWKHWKVSPLLPEENLSTLVIDHEKARFKKIMTGKDFDSVLNLVKKKFPERNIDQSTDRTSLISYQEVIEQIPLAASVTREIISLYDGRFLRDNNSGSRLGMANETVLRPVYNIRKPSASQQDSWFHLPNFLDWNFYGITGKELPNSYNLKQRFRLPDVLAKGTWRVVAEREQLDGAACLVIQSSETEKLWLDPKAGFAVRRWTKDLPYKHDFQYHDFRQVADQFWIPWTIVATEFADDRMPEEYRGKPCRLRQIDLKRFDLNQPVSQEYFQLVPPPGAWVFDSTIKPLDSAGNAFDLPSIDGNQQALDYIQPANSDDTPQVVKQAQMVLGARIGTVRQSVYPVEGQGAIVLSTPTTSTTLRWFIIANLLLITVGSLIYWLRSRQSSSL